MDKNRLIKYTGICFLITWGCWWVLAWLTKENIVNSSQGIFTVLHMAGGFGPTVAAILVQEDKSPRGIIRFVFSARKGAGWYVLLFCLMQGLILGLSSMEKNPAVAWAAVPVIMLSATVLGGGNEELGWRGVMQPELEKKLPFPLATLVTAGVWMLWHVPLWFVAGTSQQNMNFALYAAYGTILSFWLAALYKRTGSVFACCLFHGFSNLMLSLLVIKINWLLIAGLAASLAFTLWLSRRDEKGKA